MPYLLASRYGGRQHVPTNRLNLPALDLSTEAPGDSIWCRPEVPPASYNSNVGRVNSVGIESTQPCTAVHLRATTR